MTSSINSQLSEAVYVALHMSNGPSKADLAAGPRAIVAKAIARFGLPKISGWSGSIKR